MTEPYSAAHLSELEADTGSGKRWATVRTDFGIASFGVNAYSAEEPGADVIGEHDEIGPRAGQHEELYFVSAGHATFTVNGEEIDAPAGTFVYVRDPAAKRRAVTKEGNTTVVVIGGKAGAVFEPSAWERSAPALKHWNRDWPKAAELMRKAHEEHPDDPAVLYNLACAEAQNGETAPAVEHLRRALELEPEMRTQVHDDSDLAPLRDQPGYEAATA